MSEATPRITAPYLEKFSHQTVRIVGKVLQLRGEQATIDSHGQITVHLNRDAHLQPNGYVEIIGKVQNDLSVRAFASMDLGNSVDMAAAEAVVDATHRYKKIFYSD